MDDLERFILAIERLRRWRKRKSRPAPHKLIMLLAVLDLVESGLLRENCIHFDDHLIRQYKFQHQTHSPPEFWCQPSLPYFHLRTSGFWHHRVKAGRQKAYDELTTSGGGSKRISENIEYAYLSDFAWRVVSDSQQREQLRSAIIRMLAWESN